MSHLDRFIRFCVHHSTSNAFQWGKQPPKLPLLIGNLDTHLHVIMVSLADPSQPRKRHLDRLPVLVQNLS